MDVLRAFLVWNTGRAKLRLVNLCTLTAGRKMVTLMVSITVGAESSVASSTWLYIPAQGRTRTLRTALASQDHLAAHCNGIATCCTLNFTEFMNLIAPNSIYKQEEQVRVLRNTRGS